MIRFQKFDTRNISFNFVDQRGHFFILEVKKDISF